MTDEQNKQLENLFRTELQKQYIRGLRAGIKTASTVCLEKINDSSKPLLKRIEDVKRYCAVSLRPDFLTKGIDDNIANAAPAETENEIAESTEIKESTEIVDSNETAE